MGMEDGLDTARRNKRQKRSEWLDGESVIILLSLFMCLFSGCDIQLKHQIYLKNGCIHILLSVPSYWDAHGHTNMTTLKEAYYGCKISCSEL